MSKRQKVDQLIVFLGGTAKAIKYFDQFLATLREYSEVPGEFDKFFEQTIIPTILEQTAQIYEDSLEEEFLDEILLFYYSQIGQILLEKSQLIQSKINEKQEEWVSLIQKELDKYADK